MPPFLHVVYQGYLSQFHKPDNESIACSFNGYGIDAWIEFCNINFGGFDWGFKIGIRQAN